MSEIGGAREMWTWGENEEPEAAQWCQWSSKRTFRRGPEVKYEGETIWPTREAAIRHAIVQADLDWEVLTKAALEIEGKRARLVAMLGEGIDAGD